jgi:group I intron endonuclease
MGYIYKITNIINNKCYIGETKKNNPECRWNEHKSKINKGIGCPRLQYAVKKYGIENFKFDILIICFDEDRYKFEKEYIKKYNSLAPNGYNLTPGGEGGGFYGKKHNIKSKDKIKKSLTEIYKDSELRKKISCRNKIIMNSEDMKIKIKEALKNSEKYKNAKKGNINKNKHTSETIDKLKNITHNYFNDDKNIIKHREIMAYKKGFKISQYDINNNLINSYISIREASRQTNISRTSIGKSIKMNTLIGNYYWKKQI